MARSRRRVVVRRRIRETSAAPARRSLESPRTAATLFVSLMLLLSSLRARRAASTDDPEGARAGRHPTRTRPDAPRWARWSLSASLTDGRSTDYGERRVPQTQEVVA